MFDLKFFIRDIPAINIWLRHRVRAADAVRGRRGLRRGRELQPDAVRAGVEKKFGGDGMQTSSNTYPSSIEDTCPFQQSDACLLKRGAHPVIGSLGSQAAPANAFAALPLYPRPRRRMRRHESVTPPVHQRSAMQC